MKFLFFFVFGLCAFTSQAQTKSSSVHVPDSTKPVQVVETACGQCKLGLAGTGCTLAVRIKDQSYFVEGTEIDDHGDAHAKDGFCNSVRKAEVQGTVVNNRFKVSYFKLLKGN